MTYLNIAHWSKRPIIYSLILAFGYLILFGLVEESQAKLYILSSFILYGILLTELLTTSNFYHVHHKKNTKAIYDLEHHKTVQYLHHLIFPTLLYVSFIVFLYFNNQAITKFFLLIIFTASFALLFENIHAFYKHKFSLNKETHYVYDLLSVIAIFMLVDGAINYAALQGLDLNYLILIITTIFFLFSTLALLRHIVVVSFAIIAVAMSVMIGLIAKEMLLSGMSITIVAGVVTLIFVVFNSYLNHYIEKTLTKDVLIEYILVLFLALSLLYAIGV